MQEIKKLWLCTDTGGYNYICRMGHLISRLDRDMTPKEHMVLPTSSSSLVNNS